MWRVVAAVVTCMLLIAPRAYARFSKNTVPAGSRATQSIVFGSGIEYLPHTDQSELEIPLFLECDLSSRLAAIVDWGVIGVQPHGEAWRYGLKNLETKLTYLILADRRNRPSLSFVIGSSWPTVHDESFGSQTVDPSMGMTVSHQFVRVLLELVSEIHFQRFASRDLECAALIEYEVSPSMDLLFEARYQRMLMTPTTPDDVLSAIPEESLNDYSIGVGIARQMSSLLKLDGGIAYHKDGAWQFLFGWEFEFGGD